MSLRVPLLAATPEFTAAAAALAQQYQLPAEDNGHAFVLELGHEGLHIRWRERPEYQPLQLDYTRGKQAWRQQLGGGKQEAVVRALGVSKGYRPRVLDATAGLGRDALMLAHAGCDVWLLERSPAIHALLAQAIAQLQAFHQHAGHSEHWSCTHLHMLPAGSLLSSPSSMVTAFAPHAIYLDPMFPEREKSAAVKKEMQVLQQLVGADEDADGLLPIALELASCRVVVKRPARAPFLNGQTPSSQVTSKKHRFDVYVKQPYSRVMATGE